MRSFDILDHTADVIISGKGGNLNKAFEAIALALESLIVDITKIRKSKVIKGKVLLDTRNLELLLVKFLNELIYLKDSKKFVFSEISVNIIDKSDTMELHYEAIGEKINQKRNYIVGDVKAATYSNVIIERRDNIVEVKCLIDV